MHVKILPIFKSTALKSYFPVLLDVASKGKKIEEQWDQLNKNKKIGNYKQVWTLYIQQKDLNALNKI
jgi:hypothetical protein